MSVLLAIVFLFAPMTGAAAWVGTDRSQRAFVLSTVVGAWLVLGFLLYAMHGWMPFAGGGDDGSYYELANMPFDSFWDLLNVGRFTGSIDQPGYPWFLNIVYAVSGHDLLAYKLLNLCVMILIALTWRRIGVEVESERFGNAVMVGVLLLTPLWFYMFFLLKDLTIVLLQSVFLLGVVRQWGKPSLSAALLMMIPTFMVILFRSPLVIQNVAIVIVVSLAKMWARGSVANRVYGILIAGGVVAVVLALAANPELMFMLGIYQKGRVLEAGASLEFAQDVREMSSIRWQLFPLLYLFTETAGLSAQSWEVLDRQWLRGVLVLPWILIVVPLFLAGLHWQSKPVHAGAARGLWNGLRHARALTTPWFVVLLYIAASAAVSWTAGDTTRWRLSDMPAILTVALGGAMSMRSWSRWRLVGGWIIGLGLLLSAYYLKAEL